MSNAETKYGNIIRLKLTPLASMAIISVFSAILEVKKMTATLTEKEIKDIAEINALLLKVKTEEAKSNVRFYLQGVLDREELEQRKALEKGA